jgi:hypothetical protein
MLSCCLVGSVILLGPWSENDQNIPITKDNVVLHSIAEVGVHGCSAVSFSKYRVKGG